MLWVPATIRWQAVSSASWPVTTTFPASPCSESAWMAPPARPSFAATTASTRLFWRVRAFSRIFSASTGCQSAAYWSVTISISWRST